jgi:oligoendopeptidase F
MNKKCYIWLFELDFSHSTWWAEVPSVYWKHPIYLFTYLLPTSQ